MGEIIKIGALIDNNGILNWQFKVLIRLSDYSFIRIVLIKPGSIVLSDPKDYKLPFFSRFHEKIDRLIFKRGFDYDKRIGISELTKLTNIEIFNETISFSKSGQPNSKYDNENNLKFDILLNFGSQTITKAFTKIARYGVWNYEIGGDGTNQEKYYKGYWEVVRRLPETVGILEAELNSPDKKVLYRTSRATYPNSININRNQIYELASLIIPRVIMGLSTYGEDYLKQLSEKYTRKSESSDSHYFGFPSAIDAILNLLKIFTEFVIKRLFYSKIIDYSLMYKIKNESDPPLPLAPTAFKELKSFTGKFWADPFVIKKGDLYYIFVEEYVFETGKAHISVLELSHNGDLNRTGVVIERPYHMSYPFIFEYKNEYFMIPETKSNKTIELYKCFAFPYKWEFVCNIMSNVSAADTTLFFYNGKWWLFTAINELENVTDYFNDLFLYYSEDLFSGNWQSHPLNPVVTDLKSARPAGRIFEMGGRIYRPSQDCSKRYGYALNINQILELSEQSYSEVLAAKVIPDWDTSIIGTHTFNFDRDISVIDVARQRRKFDFSLL